MSTNNTDEMLEEINNISRDKKLSSSQKLEKLNLLKLRIEKYISDFKRDSVISQNSKTINDLPKKARDTLKRINFSLEDYRHTLTIGVTEFESKLKLVSANIERIKRQMPRRPAERVIKKQKLPKRAVVK